MYASDFPPHSDAGTRGRMAPTRTHMSLHTMAYTRVDEELCRRQGSIEYKLGERAKPITLHDLTLFRSSVHPVPSLRPASLHACVRACTCVCFYIRAIFIDADGVQAVGK